MDEATRTRIEQFRHLVRLDPEGEISHYGLAKACFDCGTLAEGRGDAAEAAERFAEACRECQRVLEIRPDYAACYLLLGLAQLKTGNREAALGTLRSGMDAARRNADPDLLKRMGDQVRLLEGKSAPRPPRAGPEQIPH